MIELTFVLLLMAGPDNKAIEYTPYKNLSECLRVRRKIKRNDGASPNFDKRWSCKELRVRMSQGEILEIMDTEE